MPLVRYTFLLLALPLQAQVTSDTIVRVELLGRTSLESVEFAAVETSVTVIVDGDLRGRIELGESVTLVGRGGLVQLDGRDVGVSAADIVLDGSRFILRAGDTVRTYEGDLHVTSTDGHLELVNHVRMAPYVASVVASELGFDVLEANKAQAILARTYAARRLGQNEHFDVHDHTGSQVYKGAATVTPVSRNAALFTSGQVLTYQGDLADAYYHSSSGGHTASNENIWNGNPVPYLRAVPDPYDRGAPDHRWETSADRQAVLSALSARYGGRVQGIEVVSRTPSDRIHRVRLIGADRSEISGNQLRSAINARLGWRTVRSTKVDITVEGDRYVFRGAGFGHGVGMSQYGAMGQAREGRTYRQILSHYFSGTEVSGGAAMVAPVQIADSRQASSTRRYAPPQRIIRDRTRDEPPRSLTRTRRTAW
ncbi:SpoIID/LytB domain-containing protein [Rubrivirga sp.]|uniref:SpoIID/LytB domain-containing protein n=1 Tax=Rubrivirga sp. TaxID=1885344 RepID=UPI003C76C9CF